MRIEGIEFVEANQRCKCGLCHHQIVKIFFDNGAVWCPTNVEYLALKQSLKTAMSENLVLDKHCFKAEQEVSPSEIMEDEL